MIAIGQMIMLNRSYQREAENKFSSVVKSYAIRACSAHCRTRPTFLHIVYSSTHTHTHTHPSIKHTFTDTRHRELA